MQAKLSKNVDLIWMYGWIFYKQLIIKLRIVSKLYFHYQMFIITMIKSK